MKTTDKVFLEGASLDDLVRQNSLAKYEGYWDVTIFCPSGLSASTSASSVYTLVVWLENYADAKLHKLNVGTSPDKTWSLALEEVIHAEQFEI